MCIVMWQHVSVVEQMHAWTAWTRGGKGCVGCIAWTHWEVTVVCPPTPIKRLPCILLLRLLRHSLPYCVYRHNSYSHVAV